MLTSFKRFITPEQLREIKEKTRAEIDRVTPLVQLAWDAGHRTLSACMEANIESAGQAIRTEDYKAMQICVNILQGYPLPPQQVERKGAESDIELKLKIGKSGVEVYNMHGEYILSCGSVEALTVLIKEVIALEGPSPGDEAGKPLDFIAIPEQKEVLP